MLFYDVVYDESRCKGCFCLFDTFLGGADKEISEKRNFFVNCSVPENFQWENFSGQVPTESLRTQDSENVYERWVQQIFDPV